MKLDLDFGIIHGKAYILAVVLPALVEILITNTNTLFETKNQISLSIQMYTCGIRNTI